MLGAFAKLGGLLLTTFGIDYAVNTYKDKTAAAAADTREANIGKVLLIAAALFFGYKLLVRK